MTTQAPTLTKRIGEYDRYSKDYPAYVVFPDGSEELVGYAKTNHDAELLASDYIIQFYNDAHTPEVAAQIIMQDVEQDIQHEQLAADMGGVWEVTTTPPEGIITTDSATCSLSIMLALDPPPGSPAVKDVLDRIFLPHPELDEDPSDECPPDCPDECPEHGHGDEVFQAECDICYSLQRVFDDGEAYICADRAACARRQAENEIDTYLPTELPALRAAYQRAIADGYPVVADSLLAHALCETERFIRTDPATQPADAMRAVAA